MLEQLSLIRSRRFDGILAVRYSNGDGSELLRPLDPCPRDAKIWWIKRGSEVIAETVNPPKKAKPAQPRLHLSQIGFTAEAREKKAVTVCYAGPDNCGIVYGRFEHRKMKTKGEVACVSEYSKSRCWKDWRRDQNYR
jgi:hypothetical protein